MRMIKKWRRITYLMAILALSLVGCEKEIVSFEKDTKDLRTQSIMNEIESELCGDPFITPIFAGQTINVGTLTVGNDETNLYVSYQLTGNWLIQETHLYVGPCDQIPLNNAGNPQFGHFPYSSTNNPPTNLVEFTIPLADLDDCYCIVAHAVVVNTITGQTETAIGFGDKELPGNRWGWCIEYCTQLCTPPPPPGDECETAFAKSSTNSTCFIDDGFNRWGWTNGPLSSGSYSMDIYAAAGQCDLSKGTLVGTLQVDYDETTGIANVTYSMTGDFTMDETHLYVGNDPYPINNGSQTVAPGQFPYGNDLTEATSDSLAINGLSGEIFIIAHAVVCGDYE